MWGFVFQGRITSNMNHVTHRCYSNYCSLEGQYKVSDWNRSEYVIVTAMYSLRWVDGEVVCVDCEQLSSENVAERWPNYGCGIVDPCNRDTALSAERFAEVLEGQPMHHHAWSEGWNGFWELCSARYQNWTHCPVQNSVGARTQDSIHGPVQNCVVLDRRTGHTDQFRTV